MPHPFDAAIKNLILRHPKAWLHALGLDSDAALEDAEADISSVSPRADKVFLVRDAPPWCLHVEFQASADPRFSERMLTYNVLLWRRHETPVESVAVLLRPEAEGSVRLEGRLLREPSPRGSRTDFRFRVVRSWELSARMFLEGGPGLLPVAPIADPGGADLESICREMERRIREEADPAELPYLWTSAHLLLGLRLPPKRVAELLKGIEAMRESSTYQEILREGREEGREEGRLAEARRFLLRTGSRKFGPPSDLVRERIFSIERVETIEEIFDAVDECASWDELLPR